MMRRMRYSMDDLKSMPERQKVLAVGLMIANELHELSKTIRNKL